MAVAVSRRPSIVPVIGPLSAVPTFTRAGFTATRVNSAGLIELVPADVPRFDYDPVTKAINGVLIEKARANVCLRSDEFDNASWSKSLLSVGANAITAPDGNATADHLIESASNGQHIVTQTGPSASGTYTFSCFYKEGARRYITHSMSDAVTGDAWCVVDLQTGVITQAAQSNVANWTAVSATIKPAGNGWYRVTLTATKGATGTADPMPRLNNASSGLNSYLGDGVSGLYAWRAQLEAAGSATSSIPTTISAVTRGADIFKVSGIGDLLNDSEGALFMEATQPALNAGYIWQLDDGDNNDRIWLEAFLNGTPNFGVIAGGVHTGGIQTGAIVAGTAFKIAAAYRTNDCAASFNGAAAVTDNTVTLPTGLVTLRIGANEIGADYEFNGHLHKFAYYDSRLTNAELQTLSAGGAITKQPVLAFDFTAEDVAAWGAPFA